MKKELTGDTLTKLAHTSRRPIDANAAADIFHPRTADDWEVPNRGHFDHSCVAPQPTMPLPPNVHDRRGQTAGRLTVIGLRARRQDLRKSMSDEKKGALWVCRCQCGCYETRRTSALTNTRNTMDCCFECRKLERLKRIEHYRLTGQRPM